MKKIHNFSIMMITTILFISSYKPVSAIYEEYFKIDKQVNLKLLKINDITKQSFFPDSDFGSIEVKTYFESSKLKGEMLFVLKENQKIIYSNIYPVEKMLQAHYFPFGFPKVKYSKSNKYQFELTLKKINIPDKLYVWYDDHGNLNYKISGERSFFSSVQFFFLRNTKNDPLFFVIYILILIFFIIKVFT